ncbi:MAG: GNAT family N-acetyltransferase, partial [Nitrospirota bacterium]|nr:GNAT family N-acetyltransferase [Nitrospirota bacterium]
PFFKHAKVNYFLAVHEGRILGRIASIVNQRHMDVHKEETGFFGFFESIDDADVSGSLLDAAAHDLKMNGMKAMRGPMNFSTNEECGFLIEGFDLPPMLMTPYNPPYYEKLMEKCGMDKAKDLYAYIHDVQETLPEKVLRVAAIAGKRGISVRPIEKKRFNEEMQVFRDVYNSAWAENWGFIPLTDDELFHLGKRLKQIAVPGLTLIAEDHGRPVGFLGLLPDFNFVLRHMRGRLTPLTVIKALYYSRKITGLRLLLLGIKHEYRSKGVDAMLLREAFKGIRKGGYKKVEFSWILEDNIPVQRIIEMADGRLYKKYRIYEKSL